MGKKVSPHALRIGITQTWDSLWYSKKDYKTNFLKDIEIRKFLKEKLRKAGVSKIVIERHAKKIRVIIHAAKSGVIIGRSGENVNQMTDELSQKFGGEYEISVKEVRKIEADAQLVAESVAEQIERRFPYRRVCKMAVEKAKESGIKGIKIMVSGRLNGVDMSRTESYAHGTVPLHTLRANIDYATAEAKTLQGIIGVKVWVYHGLVFKNQKLNEEF